MKYKEIRKTPRYRSERAADGLAITRSAFQLLLGVILLMFILSVIFIALLPIVTFQKKSGDRLQYYSVVTVRSDDFHKGDIVSLSPASASFGLYKNFEERGNHFKTIVNNLE